MIRVYDFTWKILQLINIKRRNVCTAHMQMYGYITLRYWRIGPCTSTNATHLSYTEAKKMRKAIKFATFETIAIKWNHQAPTRFTTWKIYTSLISSYKQTNKQTEKKERKKQKKNKCKILISSIFFSLLLRFCILVQLKLNVDRLLKANDDKIFTTYEWNHTPMGLNNQMLLRITQHIHCTDVHWSDTFFAL